MSIITFWSNGVGQAGKTLSLAAVCTYLAIEHNYRILVVSTGYNDETLNNCFWEKESKIKKNLGLFGPNARTAMESGFAGLTRIMRSNKLEANIITNYTKIIFKDRLEILPGFLGDIKEYKELRKYYPDLINIANGYYDLVFVDLDKYMQDNVTEAILKSSNLIVANLTQRLSMINNYMKLKGEMPELNSKKTLLLIGKYDKFSKYNVKNITRFLGERNKVSTIPYNTLFFEACEEAELPNLFLKFRKMDGEDRNGFFVSEVKRTINNIIYRLENLAGKM